MPRKRRFLERPHEHLLAAVAVHEAAADGSPAEGTEGESEAQGELSTQQVQARSQHRDQGGRFAP